MSARRRSREEWQSIVECFEASGQSARAFCAEQGLSVSYFYKRRKRLSDGPVGSFVAVRVPTRSPMASNQAIAVELGAVTIRCHADTPPAWVAELVTTLGR